MLKDRRTGRGTPVVLMAMIAIVLLPVSVFSQSSNLDIAEVLRLVLEQNAAVQIAAAAERQAEALHRQTLADTLPQVDLQLDPLYAYTKSSTTTPSEVQQFSLGLSLSQALPTAGFTSLSLSNSTSFSGDSIGQSPSASLTLSQPIWVNGKLFDIRQLSAARRASEIGWQTAAEGSREAQNGNIYTAFNLYTEVVGLRRTIIYLAKSLELADQSLRQVRINLDAGRASETDLLELEILIGLQRESLLESRYALLQVEQILANTLGLEKGISTYQLIDTFPALAMPADTAILVEEARSNNPTVRRDRLSVEQTQAQSILSGRSDAPNFSIALALLPQYKGATPTDFGASFSNLFTDGILDWSLSFGLDIPLYNGGKAEYREQANAAVEQISRENLVASLRSVQNTYEALILRQSIIRDRIELLGKNIELKRRTVVDEEKKLEVGLGTPLRVESARLDLLQVENELWQARADLFLNSLDLLALSGRSLKDELTGL